MQHPRKTKTLSLGYSPCPNDTFIFFALVHGKINTGNLQFNEILLDVETLNRKALKKELDITKISFHAYGHLRHNYCLLRSGGALGRGCGPLVIADTECSMTDLRGKRIAIPGTLTTANLLLQLYWSSVNHRVDPSCLYVLPFDHIIGAVANGEVDAGVIIHESRFTFMDYNLTQVLDLGQWWEEDTGLPIPLGGIGAKRSFGAEAIGRIDALLKMSVEYAFHNRNEPLTYIKEHSQELSDDVIRQHIDLYVNDFSLHIGKKGEKAIMELLSRAESAGIIPGSDTPIFL